MERNWRYDVMRILMSILVVLLHVAAYGCYAEGFPRVPLFYNSMGRIAVPIFFMVTGAISFNKVEPVQRCWKRSLHRILLPLLITSLLYIFYQYILSGNNMIEAILHFPQQASYYHLPFMYQMFGLYIAMPLLQRGWKALSLKSKGLLTLVLLIGDFLMKRGFLFSFLPLPGYIAYAMAGAFLVEWIKAKGLMETKHPCLLSSALMLGYVGFTCLTTAIVREASLQKGYLDVAYWSYDSLNVVFAAICMFLAIYTMPLPAPSERIQRVLSRWNGLTLGIYLVHPLLLDVLQNGRITVREFTVELTWNFFNPLFAIPLLTILCYSLSAWMVWLCQKSMALKQRFSYSNRKNSKGHAM